MEKTPAWILIVAVAIGGAFFVAGKNMELKNKDPEPTIISVSADAKVSVAPDIAELSFGVQTGRQATAKAAIDKITKDLTSAIDAVKKMGVDEKDISTASFWLNPVYDYNNGTQIPRGYEATQSLTVKVRDLDKMGEIITAATSNGANQVGSINFTIDEPEKARAEARAKAIEKAKEKAEELADELDVSIVKLKGFSEDGGGGYPVPMMYRSEMMAKDSAGAMAPQSVPMPTGQQDVQVYVTLMFEVR